MTRDHLVKCRSIRTDPDEDAMTVANEHAYRRWKRGRQRAPMRSLPTM